MSVQVYGCNHVAIEVGDVEKAVAFYQDVFNLEKLDEGEGDAFFKLGHHQFLAMFEVKESNPERMRHFGIMVRDEEQLAADGYLLKQSDAQCIAAAVHEVMNGRAVFDPLVVPVLAEGEIRLTDEERRLRSLAPGELRVLAEVAKGRTDQEAANVLNLSVKTVRNCLDRVFV